MRHFHGSVSLFLSLLYCHFRGLQTRLTHFFFFFSNANPQRKACGLPLAYSEMPLVSAAASHSASRHYSHKAQQSIPEAWDWGNIVSFLHTPLLAAKLAGCICRVVTLYDCLYTSSTSFQKHREVDIMCLNMNTNLYPDIFASQNIFRPFFPISWYILTFPCQACITRKLVRVNSNCQNCFYGVQAVAFFREIGNATVYPIHNTECPLLIKCHSINVTLLCSFSLG